MKVLKTIFKAYDIRGIYKKELTLESIDLIARSLSDLYQKDNDIIVVGRDGRLSSEAISNTLIRGLLESGKKVIDIGQVPTPLLYFAVNYFKINSGIIVTGSHNPKNYNGFKIVINDSPVSGIEIHNLISNEIGHINFYIYRLWKFFIKFIAPISVASIFISQIL